MKNSRVNCVWRLLQLTYGLLFIIAGADKFMNLITNWGKYVSNVVIDAIPINLRLFLIIVGIFEIFLGFFILNSRWTKIASSVAAIWLFLISINLIFMRIYYDIAVRDTVMAIGAIALSILSGINESRE